MHAFQSVLYIVASNLLASMSEMLLRTVSTVDLRNKFMNQLLFLFFMTIGSQIQRVLGFGRIG